MNDDFDQRLDKILDRLVSDEILHGRGLGNEIPFYAFDYPPQRELAMREHLRFCSIRSRSAARIYASCTSICWS